jgi:hypothetical protein
MFNVINNRLSFIIYIQIYFFGGVDVIMTGDIYLTLHVKDNLIFQNIKNDVNASTPNFWQTYVQCYELNKVMRQYDMVFIQTLNKFHIATKNAKDIEFVINNHPTI